MSDETIHRAAVIGTGVIGSSWAALFLAHDLKVSAWDPSAEALAGLESSIQAAWPALAALGATELSSAPMDRLTIFQSAEDAVAGAQFIQENGPEREDTKLALFQAIDAAASRDAVLATSSSGLLLSRLQDACQHPERVVLGHPFNPPHVIPLVEVLGGAQTSAATVARAMAFYTRIGKRPIELRREVPGHVANRLQAALWREAFHLLEDGVVSVKDIDTAIAHGPGLRWALLGPFANLHMSGGSGGLEHLLEHLGAPMESWWQDLGAPTLSDALKRQASDGTAEMLSGFDQEQIGTTRDQLLVSLINSKSRSSGLPV